MCNLGTKKREREREKRREKKKNQKQKKKKKKKKQKKKKKKAERTTRACVKRNGHRTKATIEPRPRLNENREAILASLWTVRKAVQTLKEGREVEQWEEIYADFLYDCHTGTDLLFPPSLSPPLPALSELNIPSGPVHPADSGDIFEIRQSASNIWLCTFHCQDSCWHGRTADSRYQFCLSSKLFTRPSFHSPLRTRKSIVSIFTTPPPPPPPFSPFSLSAIFPKNESACTVSTSTFRVRLVLVNDEMMSETMQTDCHLAAVR